MIGFSSEAAAGLSGNEMTVSTAAARYAARLTLTKTAESRLRSTPRSLRSDPFAESGSARDRTNLTFSAAQGVALMNLLLGAAAGYVAHEQRDEDAEQHDRRARCFRSEIKDRMN